jgi:phosphoserine phosphatase
LTSKSAVASASLQALHEAFSEHFPAHAETASSAETNEMLFLPTSAATGSAEKAERLAQLLEMQQAVGMLRRGVGKRLECLELEIARTVRALVAQSPLPGLP